MYVEILIALGVIVFLFLVVVAMRPSEFRVSRSAAIAAPPEAVFAQVNDFHRWEAWSPWDKIDPALQRTYEGPSAGTGAVYRWVGNKNVGSGGMTITESRASDLILIKLEFLKPFKATNTTEFTFKHDGNGTVITWTMTGRYNFMMKAFTLLMSMDKMVGGQFEKGLAELKSLTEAGRPA